MDEHRYSNENTRLTTDPPRRRGINKKCGGWEVPAVKGRAMWQLYSGTQGLPVQNELWHLSSFFFVLFFFIYNKQKIEKGENTHTREREKKDTDCAMERRC